jgi:hypothetical protein
MTWFADWNAGAGEALESRVLEVELDWTVDLGFRLNQDEKKKKLQSRQMVNKCTSLAQFSFGSTNTEKREGLDAPRTLEV